MAEAPRGQIGPRFQLDETTRLHLSVVDFGAVRIGRIVEARRGHSLLPLRWIGRPPNATVQVGLRNREEQRELARFVMRARVGQPRVDRPAARTLRGAVERRRANTEAFEQGAIEARARRSVLRVALEPDRRAQDTLAVDEDIQIVEPRFDGIAEREARDVDLAIGRRQHGRIERHGPVVRLRRQLDGQGKEDRGDQRASARTLSAAARSVAIAHHGTIAMTPGTRTSAP